MADEKVVDLTELTIPTGADLQHVVDVSDTTDSPEGTSKKMRLDAYTNPEGIARYDAVADLPVTGVATTSYKVTADPTPANNGFYSWGGASYTKDASTVAAVLDDTNLVDPVSGKAVGDYSITLLVDELAENTSYALSESDVIPYKTDALFWLDGTVLESSGSYYFVDVINSRNFLITGYDFPSDWVKGFPYKSIATISAPVADATLIAADINDFLYDSGGTPNELPLSSLFQNVDYEDKLFTRHKAQVLDSNLLETTQPLVKDIVLYDTVKTNMKLSVCNYYYNVDALATLNYWVAKDGNDSTGTGTFALPYLTIGKALAVVNDGGTIYVQTGDYAETLYSLNDQLYKAVGFTKLSSPSTSYPARLRYSTKLLWEGMFMETSGTMGEIYGNAATNLVVKRCKIIASTSAYILLGDYSEINNIIASGTTSSHAFNQSGSTQPRTIKDSYFNLTTVHFINNPNLMGELTVENNSINGTVTRLLENLNASNGVTIKGSTIDVDAGANVIRSQGDFPLISLLNNTFNLENTSSDNFQITDYITAKIVVDGNTFNSDATNEAYILRLTDSRTEVNNNLFNTEEHEPTANAEILNDITKAVSIDLCTFNNNKILSKRIGGYNIATGSEGTTAGDNGITSTEIKGNYIKSRSGYNTPTGVTVHSTFVGYQINAKIMYNFIIGGGYSAVLKGIATTIYTSGGFNYNLVVNSERGVYVKGANSVVISNNTFFSDVIQGQYSVNCTDNVGGDPSNNCVVKNNIFINLGTGTYNPIQFQQSGTGHTSDYNIFYCPNGTLTFTKDGSTYTFAQWQVLGFDTNSIELTDLQFDNLFTDYNTNDFSLKLESAAVGAGVDLGVNYNSGLDKSTAWGLDSEIPIIVNKTQNTIWDCGAYIS